MSSCTELLDPLAQSWQYFGENGSTCKGEGKLHLGIPFQVPRLWLWQIPLSILLCQGGQELMWRVSLMQWIVVFATAKV